jgi:hypothetical protein
LLWLEPLELLERGRNFHNTGAELIENSPIGGARLLHHVELRDQAIAPQPKMAQHLLATMGRLTHHSCGFLA